VVEVLNPSAFSQSSTTFYSTVPNSWAGTFRYSASLFSIAGQISPQSVVTWRPLPRAHTVRGLAVRSRVPVHLVPERSDDRQLFAHGPTSGRLLGIDRRRSVVSLGLSLAVVSAFLFGSYLFVVKRYFSAYPATVYVFLVFAFALVWYVPVALVTVDGRYVPPGFGPTGLLILGATVGFTLLGNLTFFRAIASGAVSYVAPISKIIPVFVLPLEVLLLNQYLSALQVVGVVVATIAIYVANYRPGELLEPLQRAVSTRPAQFALASAASFAVVDVGKRTLMQELAVPPQTFVVVLFATLTVALAPIAARNWPSTTPSRRRRLPTDGTPPRREKVSASTFAGTSRSSPRPACCSRRRTTSSCTPSARSRQRRLAHRQYPGRDCSRAFRRHPPRRGALPDPPRRRRSGRRRRHDYRAGLTGRCSPKLTAAKAASGINAPSSHPSRRIRRSSPFRRPCRPRPTTSTGSTLRGCSGRRGPCPRRPSWKKPYRASSVFSSSPLCESQTD